MSGFFLLLLVVALTIPYCAICHRAGWHWAWGLTGFVPLTALILLFVLAYKRWPTLEALKKPKPTEAGLTTAGQ